MGVVSQRFLSLGTQGVDRLPRFVKEPLPFGLRLVCRLTQEGGALLVKLRVLVLELVVLLFSLGLFRVCVRELRGDPLFPLINCVEDRLVKKAPRSEEHTSELQSLRHLVCRLLLEKKKNQNNYNIQHAVRPGLVSVCSPLIAA